MKGATKADRVDRRLKVGLSPDAYEAISAKAEAAGMTTAAYVRQLVAFDLGEVSARPKVHTDRERLTLLAEVHTLAMHVKKIGLNINHMARQIDTGSVPLTASEMRVMQAHVASAMEQAVALFDKVLAR